jgi:hypothetical protein
MARAALNALRQRHARVLGLIFNRVTCSHCEQYQYERYHRAYSWEGQETKRTPALADGLAVSKRQEA